MSRTSVLQDYTSHNFVIVTALLEYGRLAGYSTSFLDIMYIFALTTLQFAHVYSVTSFVLDFHILFLSSNGEDAIALPPIYCDGPISLSFPVTDFPLILIIL